MGRTFVKDHGNVRSKNPLNLHRFLRSEKQRRAIQMRSELHAMRFDLADFGEAEDLETTTVGENRMRPVDEFVQPAGGTDDLKSGPDVQMIGIAKDDLCSHLDQLARIKGLH